MVLENSSDSNPSDSFTDSAPKSDSDPYSESRTPSYNVDESNLPAAIPVLGRMFGYNKAGLEKYTGERIQRVSQVLGRPATEEESTALAYWTAKQLQILSTAVPIGIAGGLYRGWTTKGTYRFPFYQPNMEQFRPDVFPFQRMALLKGQRAMLAWHGLRMFWYGISGFIFGSLFGGSYAASVVAVGELQDPKLKAVKDAIRTKSQQRAGSLSGMQPAQRGERNGGRPAGVQYDKRNETQVDDASPTGGMFMGEDAAPAERESMKTTGNTHNYGTYSPPARSAPTPASTQDTQDRPFDAWDDASPTGGQGITESTEPTQFTQGSAWDRLRRGEKPAAIAPKPRSKPPPSPWSKRQNETQREQREGSTMGDSFAFSKTEEERSYAKDEAQKEFDARVERERRGGDFSQGNGDQKRW